MVLDQEAMVRYVKQHDHYSCGPVAILNAALWAGKKVTKSKDLKRLCRLTKCNPIHINDRKRKGTKQKNLDRALTKELRGYATVKRAGWITRQQLISYLRDPNHAAVICYCHTWDVDHHPVAGHYALCIGIKDDMLRLVNLGHAAPTSLNKKISRFYRMYMQHWENGRGTKYPRIWLLRKV